MVLVWNQPAADLGPGECRDAQRGLIARSGERAGRSERPEPTRREVVPPGNVRDQIVVRPARAGLLVHLRAAHAAHRLTEELPGVVHLREQPDRGQQVAHR
jgi:hypothetical protein